MSSSSSTTYTGKAVETSAYQKVDPYVPQIAKSAAGYAVDTAVSTANFAYGTAAAATVGAADRAVSTASGAVKYTTDTATWVFTPPPHCHCLHPGPVVNAVNSAISGATALRQDPVGTVKPYVPSFVIHTGTVNATTGYIVTKVKRTVQYVTNIPQLNKIAAPVLDRVRGKKGEEGEEKETKAAEPVAARSTSASNEYWKGGGCIKLRGW
ncbi:hypothetical protein BC829DRAFT_387513 [Chytridium lagenaria]|nr:hypothetical protein BC829DRAFT_387513 [Chytridium lagenaria]